jgi:precorrin-2 dehydrogenase/sirohydrochlorin ferrochelatase
VIAATSISEVNLAVQKEADGHGIWYNIVDHPELSNFIIPAVVRRGRLTLTVSTEGASPTLAQQITQDWENRYG